MKRITVKQARILLDVKERIYLSVGNEYIEITKDNLLKGEGGYYEFDRSTIKMLIQQLMGINTLSWKYFANERGQVLLNI